MGNTSILPNQSSLSHTSVMLKNQSNFEWEFHDIYLDLSEKGLGISIRGGIDSPNKTGSNEIYVSRILNDGAVHQDGRLQLGDIIIYVNGTSLVNVTHKEAVNIIINAGPYIHFCIKRRKFIDSSDIYEQIPDEYEEEDPLLIGNNCEDFLLENNDNVKGYNDCIKVELIRNENGFGFSLEGGLDNRTSSFDTGIYVNNITQNSPAHLNGQIAIGDEVVAINDTNLECVPYQWALNVIRNSPALSIFTIRKKIHWG